MSRNVARLGGLAHRLLHERLGAPQKALAILEALAARVETPIENLHELSSDARISRPA